MVSSGASEKVRLRFIPPPRFHPKLKKISASYLNTDYEVHGINSRGLIVARLVFNIKRTSHGCLFVANGTSSIIRRQGIATRMWQLAIKKTKPTIIEVYTVSSAGNKLINSLKKKYPKIEWEHKD